MDLVKPTNYCAEILGIGTYPIEYHKKQVLKLNDAVKFMLPNNGLVVDKVGYFDSDNKNKQYNLEETFKGYIIQKKLPYPKIALEFYSSFSKEKMVLLAEETADEGIIKLTHYFNYADFGKRWAVNHVYCLVNLNDFIILPLLDGLQKTPISELNPDDIALMKNKIESCSYILMSFLSALNCSNVKQEEIQPSKIMNKLRKEKGKQPFFSYKVLTIDTQNTVTSNKSGNGSHASPRVHLRRGHIRRLPNKTVWVNSCVVGDKSKGMVQKDYKVV